MGNVYNSISVIFFVLYSVLSARRQDFSVSPALLLPLLLFLLMVLSLSWSIDVKSSLKALGKEASLVFIPLAFMLNRKLTRRGANDVLKNYSLVMCLVALYFFIRAIIRYTETGSTNVFFYHELSTFKINAIYLSVILSMALFVFLSKKNKTFWGYAAMLFLLVMVFMLSSKNIILIDILLIISYYLFFSGLPKKVMFTTIGVFCIMAVLMGYYGKVYERIVHEIGPGRHTTAGDIHNVTMGEAWNRKTFAENHYFNGTAFRTYQARIFTEMINEDPVFFTGYGLNASAKKIEQKGIEHKVYHENKEKLGYNKLNFHNQYIEAFADLGFFGFALLIGAVLLNLKNGIKVKYFIHIAFAILMISLFLTESFLWRQRGVVFFTIFYCLFNDLLPVGTANAGHEKTHIRQPI